MPKPIIIAVDFDGVVVKHTKFPHIGKPNPGAILWMKAWQAAGARLFLWTCRNDDALQSAINYIESNGLTLEGYNSITYSKEEFAPYPKLFANIYVDDAAFGAPLIFPEDERAHLDWDVVGPVVLQRIVDNVAKL